MKEKTSVTLSREVLTGIDRIAGPRQSRSALIEIILADYLRKRAQEKRDARDIEIINRHADELNAEAQGVLRYQSLEE
jgi:metal-responsive CopG/Arc/MetJ family transcriptional regulator